MRLIIFLSVVLLGSCVTVDEKMAMVSAKALRDLKCPDGVQVKDLGKDRFGAQCKKKRSRAFYQVKCGKVPKSCRVLRFRR